MKKLKSFKKTKKKKKSEYNLPARNQSFTGFSQSYADGLNRKKRSYSEKMRRRNTLKRVLIVLGFIALFFLGYLVVSVMLNISKIPLETAAVFIAC